MRATWRDSLMEAMLRAALGALAGAAVGAAIAPLTRGLFHVPGGGVGWITVHHYPKGFDYAVIALLMIGSAAGAWIASRNGAPASAGRIPAKAGAPLGVLAAVVFLLMLFIHDHPYSLMDPFHEGEYLTPAYLLMEGGRPYADVFFFHGFATDGGLDSLILDHSPKRERRLETILDAATLALLVPIAVEICATTGGVIAGVLAALSAIGAFEVPVFPYFRLAPILISTLALLRFARTRRTGWIITAYCASTLGLLWSVDVGVYAVAATLILAIWLR
ncbi:MAG TPA: hypothetical protein VFU90_11985, partial [Candidatus Tumulicola sp.]|nr:hypothetical protein [Candidatus Tumulicola sp.]